MIKEKTKNIPTYGYISIKSNTLTLSRSIIERAVLFEGVSQAKTSSNRSMQEKVEKKNRVKK